MNYMDEMDNKNVQQGMPPAPPAIFRPSPPQQVQPAADIAAEEAVRIKEEKGRLENKISDMEKLLSQEKERALLATLKNQQDEALSSRVESSLKDIQDKMRRDRRDHEVEEERLLLKGKIKELETRLAQERETWMQTLKEQMSDRETQGRDVEGHFVHRLQEMERRWLDEKAQWQKEISSREDTIRSLQSTAEKLRELEDEFRRVSLEKAMMERDASKLKDEVARAEREKASIESYIKIIPDKERELAGLKADNAMLRGREEMARAEARHQEEKSNYEQEKLQKEIGRLQAEIGSIADRKNTEKSEEVRRLQHGFDIQMQDKEKAIADLSGEKVRAISELIKVRSFVSRVQAINAALDKERGQLRLEKMQLAQNMAAQLEEMRRLKQEMDGLKAVHQAELTRIKNGYGAEVARKHAEEVAEMVRSHQEELSSLSITHQQDLANSTSVHQAEVARLLRLRQEDAARSAAALQGEIAKIAAERQAEFDEKASQLRAKLEAEVEAEKNAMRGQLEEEYERRLKTSGADKDAMQEASAAFEREKLKITAAAAAERSEMAARIKEYEARLDKAENEAKRQELMAAAIASQKEDAERAAAAAAADAAGARGQHAAFEARKTALEGELSMLAKDFKEESANRARFESEQQFLKQAIQKMEEQAKATAEALEAERINLASLQAASEEQRAMDSSRIAEISAELDSYKAIEKSFTDRLKWAITGKKDENSEDNP